MRRGITSFIAGAVLVSLASLTLVAHHGSSGYDISKQVTLTGVVTRVEWVNPHSFVYIDVKNAAGQVENWALEGNPINVMMRSGWTKDTLKVGSEIAVIGFPARDSYPAGHVGTVSSLDQAFSYSPSAVDHVKTAHILQAGEIRFAGEIRAFGMGPKFSATR